MATLDVDYGLRLENWVPWKIFDWPTMTVSFSEPQLFKWQSLYLGIATTTSQAICTAFQRDYRIGYIKILFFLPDESVPS